MSCQLHDFIGVKEHRFYLCTLGWEDLNFTNSRKKVSGGPSWRQS